MMQIRCLPSCQNFEPPNVPSKQNSRGLRKTSSTGRATRRGRGGSLVIGEEDEAAASSMGTPASRILRDTSSLVAALSKRHAHKEIQNHKFETRNEESFKVQVFSFKRRQKTSRQKKLDQKPLSPKSTTRVSYLPSAKRLFIRNPRSPSSLPFVFLRVHSRFEHLCKSRRCGAASPYRQKRQDFKKQDSREEAGSPSFTPIFPP